MSPLETSPNSQNSRNHLTSGHLVARRKEKVCRKVQEILGRTLTHNNPSFDNKLASVQVFERDQVLESPQNIGITFDQKFLIDPKEFWWVEDWIQYMRDINRGLTEEEQRQITSGEAEEYCKNMRKSAIEKQGRFQKYLESFWWKLIYARAHPAGTTSALTPSRAVKYHPDGSWEITLSQEYIDQLKLIQKHSKDLTVVVQFYDHRLGQSCSYLPDTQERINQYIWICERLIESVGDEIQLEIWIETNVSPFTGKQFQTGQFLNETDPEKYAEFLFAVTNHLKSKYPKIRIAMAGIACFDPTYAREVLEKILLLKEQHHVVSWVVDTISFHPYREVPEVGSVEIQHGKFQKSTLTIEQQIQTFQDIGKQYGVMARIGETNYRFSDPDREAKLRTDLWISWPKIQTLIYPSHEGWDHKI